VTGAKKDKLSNILKYGLVGMSLERKVRVGGDVGTPNSPMDYVDDLKNRERPSVYFSIVGRSTAHRRAYLSKDGSFADRIRYFPTIAGSGWITEGREEQDGVAVTFNLDQYVAQGKEEDSVLKRRYSVHTGYKRERYGEEETSHDDQFGFKLSPRIPPRFFTGIIFKSTHRELVEDPEMEKCLKNNQNPIDSQGVEYSQADFETDLSVKVDARKYYHLTPDTDGSRRKARLLAQEMMRLSKPENWVPIYDYYGNMWWPEEISNEEIVRMKYKERYGFNDTQFDHWKKLCQSDRQHWPQSLSEKYRKKHEKWSPPTKHWQEEDEDLIAEYIKNME
jgi:hypothetical protein